MKEKYSIYQEKCCMREFCRSNTIYWWWWWCHISRFKALNKNLVCHFKSFLVSNFETWQNKKSARQKPQKEKFFLVIIEKSFKTKTLTQNFFVCSWSAAAAAGNTRKENISHKTAFLTFRMRTKVLIESSREHTKLLFPLFFTLKVYTVLYEHALEWMDF